MLVGIYDLKDHNGHDLVSHKHYERILDLNGIPYVRINVSTSDFWTKLSDLDLLIMRGLPNDSHHLVARDLLPIVEREYGINCYPNQKTYWHYDDKVRQYFLMKSHDFPMVECQVFYDRQMALEWLKDCDLPIVFKLRNGAGSKNVILVKKYVQGKRLIKKMFGRGITPRQIYSKGNHRFQYFNLYREFHHFCGNLHRWIKGVDTSPQWKTQKNYVLFQKFLPRNSFDTRITVIGERAFGFRRKTRKGDFRASGSGLIDYDLSQIDMRCIEIAHRVSATCQFQSMAYDFLFNKNGEPEFCEISYDYVSKAVYQCPGYWDRDLNWYDGHFWPEHLHLMDSLGLQDLKATG